MAFSWALYRQKQFDNLKHALSSTPVLGMLDPGRNFILRTDA
jgi:hypothetical protein